MTFNHFSFATLKLLPGYEITVGHRSFFEHLWDLLKQKLIISPICPDVEQ